MCLILFSYRVHGDFPLVLAANRDERFARATHHARFWPESPELLAGRDLQAGGTWLGITRQGRFAAITNVRESNVRDGRAQSTSSEPLSRGQLTSQFLLSRQSASEYADTVLAQATNYRGFNLLLFDGSDFVYCNNQQIQSQQLGPGTYGLSNGLLDAPWPKIVKGKRGLESLLSTSLTTEDLISLLGDNSIAADHQLPNTGVGVELERTLSPLFIRSDSINGRGYGTCNSTALIVNKDQQTIFHERNFYPPPFQPNPADHIYQFSIKN